MTAERLAAQRWLVPLALALLVVACGEIGEGAGVVATASHGGVGCADVIDGSITGTDAGFTVSATVRSTDRGWDKYADVWQVRGPDGVVLGERVLTHPHETEQPFTRSLAGVRIPREVTEVVLAAHDLVAGYCGTEFEIEVPHQ